MPTLAGAVRRAERLLEAHGFPAADAARDAVLLARHVLGWDAVRWLTGQRETAPPEFATALSSLVSRRAGHEPIAYLLGEREFYGRAFRVTRDVLIPRPETELIVDQARELALAPHTIVDVGTGSGCLAVTLALEYPAARVVATDASRAALEVAAANARALGAAGRIEFRHTSFLDGIQGPVDLIVTNPPYVAARDRAVLPPEVRDFEPAAALFAGDDGLEAFRAIVPAAAGVLAAGGTLLTEIGQGQLDAVRRLIDETGSLQCIRVRPDLQGIPRAVVVRRV